jgi:hypothetical protein
MSTAAMNAVDQSKAGAASGILSMSRMVGGTFGVAVMGALIQSLGRSHLEELLPRATSGQIERLTEALAGGGRGISNAVVAQAVQTSFLDAVNLAMKVGAGFALVGAVVSWVLIDVGPVREPQPHSAEERLELDLVEAGDAGGAPQGEPAIARELAH